MRVNVDIEVRVETGALHNVVDTVTRELVAPFVQDTPRWMIGALLQVVFEVAVVCANRRKVQ